MYVKDLSKCKEFIAGDDCLIRELLNPRLNKELALGYSLAHAIVKPGDTTRLHRMASSEVYYILEGKGIMNIDNEQKLVSPGQTIYIPPKSIQSITNSGQVDLVFLAIVDPAWREEDEDILL